MPQHIPEHTGTPFDLAGEMKKGVFLHRAGRLPEAERIYREILARAPDHPDALHLLGLIAHQSGHPEAGASLIQKAIRKDPGNAVFWNNLGNVSKDRGEFQEAVNAFQRAVRLNPRLAEAWINLGNVRKYLGNRSGAETAYRRALAVKPDAVSAYFNWAQIRRFEGGEEGFAVLESLKKNQSLSPKESVQLHFALGKMYADIPDYETAIKNYRAANDRHRRSSRRFSIEDFRQQVSLYIQTFDGKFFASRKGLGIETEVPVFIVGMPRSGTTLVEQILSSHPSVFGAGELPHINRLIGTLLARGNGRPFSQIVESVDADATRDMGNRYLAQIRAIDKTALRITDKLPGNFLNLGFISLLLPGAKIIHCRRDPMDTCLSCYFTHFDQDLGYTNDLRTVGLYYRQYRRLMAHWQQTLPIPILEVSYETLVADPEGVSRRMIRFCGLQWDPRCLEFYKNRRSVQTASGFQVRQKIYQSSVGRWKNYAPYLTPLTEALAEDP